MSTVVVAKVNANDQIEGQHTLLFVLLRGLTRAQKETELSKKTKQNTEGTKPESQNRHNNEIPVQDERMQQQSWRLTQKLFS